MIKKRRNPVPTKNQLYILDRIAIDCNDCWEWQGTLTQDGYGRACASGMRNVPAHRASYECFVGPVGDRMVLHFCDNRGCVNPEHLYLGDHNDNMQDMVARLRAVKGSDHHLAKLTDADTLRIYEDARPYRQIAADYGIAYNSVRNIKTGKA